MVAHKGEALDIQKKICDEMDALNQKFSLVIIDIDFFLRYCIRFTNHECDQLMKKIELFLQKEFSNMYFFHQNGCDEFYILMEGYDNKKSKEFVDKVRCKFRKEQMTAFLGEYYKTVRLTFSAGIASNPENGDTDKILNKAVTALFVAKAMRRNQVQYYEEKYIHNPSKHLLCPNVIVETYAGIWGKIGKIKEKTYRRDGYFWEPQAITISKDGKIYIADQNNHQILLLEGDYLIPVAGTGNYGRTPNGILATKGSLNKPTGLCVFNKDIYITDTGNDIVIRLDTGNGHLYHVCGTGQAGYYGDGELAINAFLNKPGGVAVDAYGNLYINDIANNVIRKIDTYGIISTFAGNGCFGFYGDGGLAINASFNEIYGIGTDNEGKNLYLVDYFNHRIRSINVETGYIRTIAGNGIPGFSGDGGSPEKASLNRPVAVCSDYQNNIYIAESGNHSIRVILAKRNRIYTLVGGCGVGSSLQEKANNFRLANPNSLATFGQMLYFLDGANNKLCRMNLSEVLR